MEYKNVYFLGIGGIGMSALARYFLHGGYAVAGYDRTPSHLTGELEAEGAAVHYEDDVRLIPEGFLDPKKTMVVYTPAVPQDHGEYRYFREHGFCVEKRSQMLGHLAEGKYVMAVAGTHGKTTTSSMVLHILQKAGLEPGWLIGGVPLETHASAGLGKSKYFVIEADEYDTAFFDKRSKFVHYHPMTAVLNNLEYDHADIFENLAAIEKQFHHLVRTIPRTGLVVANARSEALDRVLEMGCWSRTQRFNSPEGWSVDAERTVRLAGTVVGSLAGMPAAGLHNASNAIAAIAAACDAGVTPEAAVQAMGDFAGVARRLEVKGKAAGVTVIDDFAHHPSAIEATIEALREKVGRGRILVVFEPRSNTMKLGSMKDRLAPSLSDADRVYCYKGPSVQWDPAIALLPLGAKASTFAGNIEELARIVAEDAKEGDTILCMSNGGFGGICGRLLEHLKAKEGAR